MIAAHRRHVLDKLRLPTRAELVRFALEQGSSSGSKRPENTAQTARALGTVCAFSAEFWWY
jgi:hypothetical protein